MLTKHFADSDWLQGKLSVITANIRIQCKALKRDNYEELPAIETIDQL